MTVQYLSQEKFDALKQEREQIKQVEMPKTADLIHEATQLGDLKENAEYHAAKDRMGWLDGRLKEIDSILDHAQITQKSTETDTVGIGSVVTVDTGKKEKTYTLVGAQEADPLSGKISNESPIGEALFGKKKGSTVTVDLPAGPQEYTIVNIA